MMPQSYGVLWIRGGLGNQLFQISALAYYSRRLNFIPLIYDGDLWLSKRDDYYPQYRKLRLSKWFSINQVPRTLSKFEGMALRKFIRFSNRHFIFSIVDFKGLSGKERLPKFFIIRDSFEDDFFPRQLSRESLKDTYDSACEFKSLGALKSQVALFLRVEGYEPLTKAGLKRIQDISEALYLDGIVTFDVYSDTPNKIRSTLEKILRQKLYWPEKDFRLDGPLLLRELTRYKLLITNGSSLSRWAKYLKSADSPESLKLINIEEE
jgi:hypothetical protein